MKILYSNLNILNIRCDGKDNTKQQRRCVSTVVLSKKNGGVNRHENKVKR